MIMWLPLHHILTQRCSLVSPCNVTLSVYVLFRPGIVTAILCNLLHCNIAFFRVTVAPSMCTIRLSFLFFLDDL